MIRFSHFPFALLSTLVGAGLFLVPPAAAQNSKKTDEAKSSSKSSSKPAAKTSAKPSADKPAAGGPQELGKFGDWGAYAANAGKAKTCYALGRPKERLPKALTRDPSYVFISNRPGEGVKNEVSIIMGFDVKTEAEPKAEIGSTNFEMVAKGANLWVKNPAQESQFIDALKRNQRLIVKATSKRGNSTTDTYSLAGMQSAIDRSSKECQ